jgi:serine/threonine-protein kinase
MTDADPQSADDRDERLLELLEALLAQQRQGQAPDVESLARENPDVAEELRQLWATMYVAELAGDSQSDVTVDSGPMQKVAAMTLPRTVGDYELLEEIGRGGMGVVYKARQKSLGRVVALKMLLSGEMASPDDQARFQAEAEAAAGLDHPGIVPVFEVGEGEGWAFFSMKLIEGHTLAERLRDGPLPAREAAELLAKISRAIHYAHERGVLHRDVKPSNILIDESGEPHVMDFGLAKRLSGDASLTRTGAILGTPSYMSPEQAAGSRGSVGPASDVYSLGTVLYAMLTGRPAFQAASPVDTLLMVLEQDPLPPHLINARADRDLEMIALRCLQKPADLRYDSAAALADDLEAYLAGEPISARSGHFSQVIASWFRETHHATVLQNWGLLWMWHSLVLLVLCLVTNWVHWRRDVWPVMDTPWPYLFLWGGGMAVWAPIFWALRRRSGPVTFVERQIAHVWGGSVICSVMLFVVEAILHKDVLSLSPVLGLINGMVFIVKAGILSGEFYVHAGVMFATAALMAFLQWIGVDLGITVFGIAAATTFFVPGLKYYRQRDR